MNGWVKIEPWFSDVDILKNVKYVYMKPSGEERRELTGVKVQKNKVTLKFKNYDTIERVSQEKGRIVYVKKEELNLKKDEILIQDLIGMEIYDFENKNKFYGTIENVIETGANYVYVIKDKENKENLIPVIDSVIKERRYEEEKIYIKVMEGMFDV